MYRMYSLKMEKLNNVWYSRSLYPDIFLVAESMNIKGVKSDE